MSTAPSTTRLSLLPSPPRSVSAVPALPLWVVAGRQIFFWLEHPWRSTARVVRFAAIVVCCYALLLLVML